MCTLKINSISKKKSMKNIINVLNVNGCKIEDKNDVIPLIIIGRYIGRYFG